MSTFFPFHLGIYADMLVADATGATYRVQFWHGPNDSTTPELIDQHSMESTMTTLEEMVQRMEQGSLWPIRHPWLPTDKWLLWERNLDSLQRKPFRQEMQKIWEERTEMRRAA
jgi:hypothetical protein